MAFRPLTEGDCGQVNPLAKLTSHVTQDFAFSDNNASHEVSNSDQLVQQFLQEVRDIPTTFRMDDLMREMHEIESQRSIIPPITASAVKDQLYDDQCAQQFIQHNQPFHDNQYEDVWKQISAHEQEQIDFQTFDHIWNTSPAYPKETSSTTNVRPNFDVDNILYSKFTTFMRNLDEGDVNLDNGKLLQEEEAQKWSDEFLHNIETTPMDELWSNEFSNTKDEETKASFWQKLQDEMEKVTDTGETKENPWVDEFNLYSIPQKDYEFSDDNPMLDLPNAIERGKQFLEAGDFPSAVLCFEAAVKQKPEETEGWLLLGTTQAENEQDNNAIAALNKCLQLDPTNLTALMAAAVSYTNESYYNQACFMLINWLKHNPKYGDLVPDDLNLSRQVTSILVPANRKLVQDLFLKAAQRNPKDLDSEVQCCLGVLCNITEEYDKAADCFRAALSVRPNDARLWNRLGATLANGSKSEEAVEAYHRALSLVPGFIRARYNVGITCINLRAYNQAVEHFLTALNQQARGRDVLGTGSMSQMSDTIWSTLMMCVSLMDRTDLRPLVKSRNLQELNRIFNID
ncbi:hypothetical protein GWI33_007560 [Rhynchophorus ferrugineus]|uniref:Peroxisomal targeting signal 1 receptor n=1 Tax=Rhynchophorus ferrugineus TaxID=354439 RepID=A0A834ISY8_RHYFE|nr:hypothetical protein GWI33_007560 [Rhynchophorus ferrugineus]